LKIHFFSLSYVDSAHFWRCLRNVHENQTVNISGTFYSYRLVSRSVFFPSQYFLLRNFDPCFSTRFLAVCDTCLLKQQVISCYLFLS
jgi:hypothetical protein